MQPDDVLIAALRGLKRSWWESDGGTWLTLELQTEGSTMWPAFLTDEPEGARTTSTRSDWVEELQRYARSEVPVWWRQQLE